MTRRRKPDAPPATIARLLGDPTRARMVAALMHGQALTATELALEGGVSPSTASSHLSGLVRAGLVTVARRGRHRYFAIAGHEVAEAIEALLRISGHELGAPPRVGPRDPGLRLARVCYDHLAGTLGVRLLGRLLARGHLYDADGALSLTRGGAAWCSSLGIDVDAMRAGRRPICLPCLDWSERRTHLAGALGARLLELLLARKLVRRDRATRAIHFSPRGEAFVETLSVA